jgi:D-alanyl-D-alanine carboxypeptidase (penicillin-binding protein 5/6)
MAKSFRNPARILLALLVLHALDAGAVTKKKRPLPAEPADPPLKLRSRSAPAAPALTSRTPAKPTPAEARPLASGELPIVAKGAIVIDACTGQPLYEKSADEPRFPASTTKIMTALLVIEAGDLDREVEIAVEDSKIGESSLNIQPGEHYTRRDMLYGLMLKSANDVAYALGRDNAGTAGAFAEKMTRRARELGASNTSFMNPNGLHDPQHFTTPRDLAIIARAAMQQPYFRQVVGTQRYQWKRPTGEIWALTNHNRLLGTFPGTTGVKTGFTNPAQQVLVSACLRGTREVIAVVMQDSKPNNWDDSRLLLTYGIDNPPGTRPVPRFP